jgi:TolB protein
MKYFLIACFLITGFAVAAQSGQVGIFKNHADIGNPKVKGATSFDSQKKSYHLKGGGYNIWFNRDEFHYAYNSIKGDFILTANVKLLGEGKTPHRKIGWMVRASEADSAAHMSAVVHGDGLTVLQWRRTTGANMRDPEDEIFAKQKNAEVVQLERSGKTFIMRIALTAGEPLQEVGRTDAIDMPDKVLAGLFICSHSPDVQEEGEAWNVQIKKQ